MSDLWVPKTRSAGGRYGGLMVSKRLGFEVFALVYLAVRRGMGLVSLLFQERGAKELEILVLRHQLSVLGREVGRLKLKPADRALLAAFSRVLSRERWKVFFVEPDTLLRWHPAAGGAPLELRIAAGEAT
jgi:hypothetical protein